MNGWTQREGEREGLKVKGQGDLAHISLLMLKRIL